MSLMLMTAERAVGLITMFNSPDLRWEKQRPIIGPKKLFSKAKRTKPQKNYLVASITLALVSIAISIPSATSAIPVKAFKNRYICAVDA